MAGTDPRRTVGDREHEAAEASAAGPPAPPPPSEDDVLDLRDRPSTGADDAEVIDLREHRPQPAPDAEVIDLRDHRPLPTLEILDVPVVQATAASALAEIARLGSDDAPARVVYVNAHTLNLCWVDPEYRRVICESSVVLNDGIGVELAARIQRTSFPENLNGSDFNPRILELAAERGWKVFLLGGRPGVADRAATTLQASIDGLQIAGTRDGFFDRSQDAEVAAQVRAAGADVLVVAMGNPLQERWLAANLDATGARVGVGVGAFLDFVVGAQKRAPLWMNRWGVEWVWRLAQEPRRMWRRYVVGNPVFLARVLRTHLARRRPRPRP